MAHDESSFKYSFRKSLAYHFPEALLWTNTDMFNVGLPDFSVLHRGTLFAVEAKFIKKLPVRGTSRALNHPASDKQIAYLTKCRNAGGVGILLIGLSDVAVIMPPSANFTVEELLSSPYRIEKKGAAWDVSGFFDAAKAAAAVPRGV